MDIVIGLPWMCSIGSNLGAMGEGMVNFAGNLNNEMEWQLLYKYKLSNTVSVTSMRNRHVEFSKRFTKIWSLSFDVVAFCKMRFIFFYHYFLLFLLPLFFIIIYCRINNQKIKNNTHEQYLFSILHS